MSSKNSCHVEGVLGVSFFPSFWPLLKPGGIWEYFITDSICFSDSTDRRTVLPGPHPVSLMGTPTFFTRMVFLKISSWVSYTYVCCHPEVCWFPPRIQLPFSPKYFSQTTCSRSTQSVVLFRVFFKNNLPNKRIPPKRHFTTIFRSRSKKNTISKK